MVLENGGFNVPIGAEAVSITVRCNSSATESVKPKSVLVVETRPRQSTNRRIGWVVNDGILNLKACEARVVQHQAQDSLERTAWPDKMLDLHRLRIFGRLGCPKCLPLARCCCITNSLLFPSAELLEALSYLESATGEHAAERRMEHHKKQHGIQGGGSWNCRQRMEFRGPKFELQTAKLGTSRHTVQDDRKQSTNLHRTVNRQHPALRTRTTGSGTCKMPG